MILSLLTLDKEAIKRLRVFDAYGVHRVVYDLFPLVEGNAGMQRDFLFYEIERKIDKKVLILSQRRPQVPLIGSIELRTLPDEYFDFDTYRFQVLLNPVLKRTGSSVLEAIRGTENLFQWFLGRASSHGFEVDENSLNVSGEGVQRFKKGKNVVTNNRAQFNGVLRVKDKSSFKRSAFEGIGRGKAFGFGLLQLVPVQKIYVEKGEKNEQ